MTLTRTEQTERQRVTVSLGPRTIQGVFLGSRTIQGVSIFRLHPSVHISHLSTNSTTIMNSLAKNLLFLFFSPLTFATRELHHNACGLKLQVLSSSSRMTTMWDSTDNWNEHSEPNQYDHHVRFHRYIFFLVCKYVSLTSGWDARTPWAEGTQGGMSPTSRGNHLDRFFITFTFTWTGFFFFITFTFTWTGWFFSLSLSCG